MVQYDLFHNALDVLHMVSLVPDGRKLIVNVTLSDGCAGVGVILDVAELVKYSYPGVKHAKYWPHFNKYAHFSNC